MSFTGQTSDGERDRQAFELFFRPLCSLKACLFYQQKLVQKERLPLPPCLANILEPTQLQQHFKEQILSLHSSDWRSE